MATNSRPVVTTPQHQAKRPVTPLAGPYGHPFHPILVTVPIGAWVVSLVFDLASRWAGEPEVFVKGAFWLIGVGILGALAAAVFGLLDLLAIPRGTPAFRTGLTHMALNLTVVALYAVSFALRRDHLDEANSTVAAVVISVVALAILGVSGWLGGKLAYHYGVRVADETTQSEGFTNPPGPTATAGPVAIRPPIDPAPARVDPLMLSGTVEHHLRKVFGKLGVAPH